MRDRLIKLIGRKFILGLFALLSGAALEAFGALTGQYVTIVVVVFGAFSAADTAITRKFAGINPNREGTEQEAL